MPGISNIIERFIKEMLENAEDGIVEIGRNDLASNLVAPFSNQLCTYN